MSCEKDKDRINRPAGRFAFCVSLGWFCGTASAMDRHGLRFSSGPFDWYFSDLPGVLQTIDEDFAEYLQIGHLRTVAGKPKEFQDIKYGFYYNHDVKENFEKEYEEIRAKYLRRIARFRKAIRQPTCFFRAVRSADEIDYINHNRDTIESILKKSNEKNSVVFLLLDSMQPPIWGTYFYLHIDQYIGQTYKMLTMFDRSAELMNFCADVIDSESKQKNFRAFEERFTPSQKAWLMLEEAGINAQVRNSMAAFFQKNALFIWGAGSLGTAIGELLEASGVRISGYIDRSAEKQGASLFGARVFAFADVADKAEHIFISVASPEVCGQLFDQVHGQNPAIHITSFSDLFRYLHRGRGDID